MIGAPGFEPRTSCLRCIEIGYFSITAGSVTAEQLGRHDGKIYPAMAKRAKGRCPCRATGLLLLFLASRYRWANRDTLVHPVG